MSFSDELRTWPYSSKPIGKALLAEWANRVEEMEIEIEDRGRHIDRLTEEGEMSGNARKAV